MKDLEMMRAPPEQWAAAMRLALAPLEAVPRERYIQQVLADPAGHAVLLDGLWIASREGHLAAAISLQVQPGRNAMVSAPQVAGTELVASGALLLDHVLAQLAADGLRLAQALTLTDHGPEADLWRGAGFEHVSELLYLVSFGKDFPTEPVAGELQFEPYRASAREQLAAIVQRTYAGTLDCPRLSDARSMDDVLNGYQATGVFAAERWLTIVHRGREAGCLLLADHPANDQWELVYLGIVPEERGQGLGLVAVRHAQWLARAAGRGQLVLAVDGDNAPAIAAYAAAGFIAWDRRSVLVRKF